MADQGKPRTANDILAEATPDQARWVVARLSSRTDQEAAKKSGIHPSTVSKWPNKGDLDLAVVLLLSQTAEAAALILVQAAPKAALALVESLQDKRSRVSAANSILDRSGVLATQRHEHSGKDGQPLTFTVVRGDGNDDA